MVKEQMRASLLINPRYTEAEFTKYSFPGKNIEYMVSGTPTLTTLLPGMPKEYFPHVYLLDDETVDGMANMLREIHSKPKEEIERLGQETKEWMLKNKNNKAQVAELIHFVNDCFAK